MESIKIILLICIGIVFPTVLGSLADSLFLRRKRNGTWKEWYLGGCLIYGTYLAAVSFVCMQTNVSFERSAALILAFSVVLAVICVLIFAFRRSFREQVIAMVACDLRKPTKAQLCMLGAFLLVACVYLVRPFSLGGGFDTPERVVTMIDTGRLSGVNVLTGEVLLSETQQGMQTDYLALFYACLCKWTGLAPVKVLFDVMPFLVLLQAFCVIALFAEYFFGENRREKVTALLLFALITICGGGAYMNTSYGILFFPYESMTIFSSILLPLTVLLAFSRKRPLMLILAAVNAVCLGGMSKGIVILAVAAICLLVTELICFLMERRESGWK